MIIFTDGLERSGNVFLSYAMSLLTRKEVRSERTHQLETLQSYKEKYPFVVPVRNALPSIASSKIYRDKTFSDYLKKIDKTPHSGPINESTLKIENIINRYLEYTKFLVDNPKFFIAPFDEFTKDARNVMYKLSNQYPGLKIFDNITNADIIAKMCLQNEGVIDLETGSLPIKNPKKIEMQEMLKSEFFREIKEIQSNIDQLYERYHNLP